jgi:hypothetical protein
VRFFIVIIGSRFHGFIQEETMKTPIALAIAAALLVPAAGHGATGRPL